MMKGQLELLDSPIEICVLRDGKQIMTQILRHTPIRFGRILDNDIVLPFEGISRHHCELSYKAGQWTLQDLKSLNGVEVNGEKVTSAVFNRVGTFDLKPITIQLKIPRTLDSTVTSANSEDRTEIVALADRVPAKAGTPPSAHSSHHGSTSKQPLLNINGVALMSKVHQGADAQKARAKTLAVQVTVVWHDVLLNVDEFLLGEDMIIEINGIPLRLGRVGSERCELRSPKGTTFLDRPGQDSSLQPGSTAVWMAGDGLQIVARYVPQSKHRPESLFPMIDGDLVDPLVYSGVVHGAMALAAIAITVKPPVAAKPQPERVAKIIAAAPPQPTPAPVVVATPTPTPKPVAIATPAPTPRPIAKKPTPAPKPIAVKPPPKVQPPVAKLQPKPKPEVRKEILPERRVVEAKPEPPPKPAPTPKPFNAASVGALKALSMLSSAPAPAGDKTERIVIRKTASTDDDDSSPKTSTSQIMNNLPVTSQSSRESGTGMALNVSSKGAGYGTGGFSGKTGKRGVMGSVIGGATYTELAKSEGLTREQVMKVVQKHQTRIQQCYERNLMDDPGLAGRAEFEWEITAKGSVVASSVSVKETTLKNGEKLIDCVKGIFREMTFPTAKNGSTTTPTIGLPFGRL